MSSQSVFDEFVNKAEAKLDAVVEHGSDQELFVAGYLHGHFSLVVSQVEQSQSRSIDNLDQIMRESLDAAFRQNELEVEDQEQVQTLWRTILKSD